MGNRVLFTTAAVVVVWIAVGVCGVPVPAPPADVHIEDILEQVHLVQQSRLTVPAPTGPSPMVLGFKEKITSDIANIRVVDDSDRANLPDEISSFDQQITMLEGAINAENKRIENATNTAAELSVQCDKRALKLSETRAEVERWEAQVAEANKHVKEEEERYNTVLAAINKDLETLALVESLLTPAVKEKAKSTGIQSDALEHQANALVSSMRAEMEQARTSANNEWTFTQSRLDAITRPITNALAAATAAHNAVLQDVRACHRSVNATREVVQAARQHVTSLSDQLITTRTARDFVTPSFNERHTAREKRIAFLTNLLEKIDQLGNEVYATTGNTEGTTPPANNP